MTFSIYDPISVLMEEHQRILARLEEVRIDLSRFPRNGPSAPPGSNGISSFAEFLARDVDGFHGRKEEVALFPALARHLGAEGGPVEVMLNEHEELRHHQRQIAREVPRLEQDAEANGAWKALTAATEGVRQLLGFHIEKEDQVLFPMARTVLSSREMAEVAQICQEIESRVGESPLRVLA